MNKVKIIQEEGDFTYREKCAELMTSGYRMVNAGYVPGQVTVWERDGRTPKGWLRPFWWAVLVKGE